MTEKTKKKGEDGMVNKDQKKAVGGGIFPALAVILFLATVIGFFGDMDPEKELLYTWENTFEAMAEEEETLCFLKDSLLLGEVEVLSDGKSIHYGARLPEEARLTFGGEGYNADLTSKEESLVFSSSELSDAPRLGERQGAAAAFFQSAYAESDALPGEIRTLLGLFLSMTDPDLISSADTLGDVARSLWDIADPSCKRKNATWMAGEEKLKVKDVTYRFDSEDLKKMWTLFSSEGKKDEVQNAAVALFAATNALEGKALTAEKEEAIRAFFHGEGDLHADFSSALLSQGSEGTLSFHIYKNYVIGIELIFKSGDVTVNSEIFFGKKVADAQERTLRFTVKNGEETLLSALLSARVTENSKSAFIREWTWEISDPSSVFLTEKTESTGKIRYSWGKTKKDIGLRFVLDGKEVTFGGTLTDYKLGKKCVFELRRLEVDRVNLLGKERLTVSITPGCDGISLPEATSPLFPEGEEKDALKELFLQKYGEVVKQ
ncbi:MAG: hypothetical protein IKT50_01825 [Clostridia bacterium]|nr:hypothetical protein [Clostridia bacterium]